MSSDEEDYMSDKFLSTSFKEDIRPLIKSHYTKQRESRITAKRAHIDEMNNAKKGEKKEISKIWKSGLLWLMKDSNKAQQYRKVSQRDRLQEGLSTALTSDNKGFAILSKMGYKQGQALGKRSTGILEPIGISVKSDRAGLGREAALQDYLKQARTKQQEEIKSMAKRVRIDEESYSQKSRNVGQQDKLLRNSIALDKNFKQGQTLYKKITKIQPIKIIIKSDRAGLSTKMSLRNLKQKPLQRGIKEFEIATKHSQLNKENKPQKYGRFSLQDKLQEGRCNNILSATRKFDVLTKMSHISTLEPKIKSDRFELSRETVIQNYLKQKRLETKSALINGRTEKREFEIAAKRTRIDEEKRVKKSGNVSQQDKPQECVSNTFTSEYKGFAVLSKIKYKQEYTLCKQSTIIAETINISINSDSGRGIGVPSQNLLKQKLFEIRQNGIETREKGTEMNNMTQRFEENFLKSYLGKCQREYENLNKPDKIKTLAVDWQIRENPEDEEVDDAHNKAENWDRTSEGILESLIGALHI